MSGITAAIYSSLDKQLVYVHMHKHIYRSSYFILLECLIAASWVLSIILYKHQKASCI